MSANNNLEVISVSWRHEMNPLACLLQNGWKEGQVVLMVSFKALIVEGP